MKLNNNYNIEDYSMLLILTTCYDDGPEMPNYTSTLFPVDIIKENYGHCTIETGIYALSSYYSRMDIGFIDGHTFYIAWKNLSGWNHQYISHIYGIK